MNSGLGLSVREYADKTFTTITKTGRKLSETIYYKNPISREPLPLDIKNKWMYPL